MFLFFLIFDMRKIYLHYYRNIREQSLRHMKTLISKYEKINGNKIGAISRGKSLFNGKRETAISSNSSAKPNL